MLKSEVLENYIPYKKLNGRTSLSPSGVELWGSKDLPFFKSGWENWFTLRLNPEQNTDCIEKCFKQKFCRIEFLTKNSRDAHLYFHQE